MKRFIFLVLLSANLSAEVNWSHNASCPSPDMAKVEAILNKMTLREKVGQIIMPDIDAVTPELAKNISLDLYSMVEADIQIKISSAQSRIGKI